MDDDANAAQREYWNGRVGERWAADQEALDAHLAPVSDLLIARAAPRSGERALDVGCGTGDTILRLAATVGTVTGVDISQPMLALARERIAGLANVTLTLADAQTHAFEPPGFDLVVSRFGVMFFADPTAAMVNLRRAMTPGGRMCFLAWAALADNPFFDLPLTAAVRHLGPVPSADPRAPGPLAFSEPDYVEKLMKAAGFTDFAVRPESVTLTGGTPAEEARFFHRIGPAARLIAERDPDAATARRIEADLEAALAPYARAGGVAIPAKLWCIEARR